MTKEEFEADMIKVAAIQRNAGWSDASIASYAKEIREVFGGCEGLLLIGAGLAQDNTRHGVVNGHQQLIEQAVRSI